MFDNYKFIQYFKFHFYYRNSTTEIDIGGDSHDIYSLHLKSEMTSEEIEGLADNIYPIPK